MADITREFLSTGATQGDSKITTGMPFQIKQGGRYQVTVLGTGFGTITFQQLGPDGATYLNVDNDYVANSGWVYDLPPGTYKFVVVTTTVVSLSVARVPEA